MATRRTRKGLFVAVLAVVASWGVQHVEHGHEFWTELMDPTHIFSLLGVVLSVWGGWRAGARSSLGP